MLSFIKNLTTSGTERLAPVLPLACLLFMSGSCALIFQMVWIRELRLIFGASTSASAAVLAIFMGGLGFGNLFFGRRVDRSSTPLRFYASLEAGISITAAISPFLVDLIRTAYVGAGGQAALGSTLATVMRVAGSVIVLAVPTFLMGGTLPATARAVSRQSDTKRSGLALLYGLNTIGAVVGAAIGNFMLLEWLGNRTLLWSACVVNLLLSLAAWCYSSRLSSKLDLGENVSSLPLDQGKKASNHEPAALPQAWLIYASSATVGCVFFLMEIVWYRMLGPLLGGTTYTFGLILCTALLGIGIGGAVYSVASRWITPSLTWLAAICSLEAAVIALPYWYGDDIAFWVLEQGRVPLENFSQQVWNWFCVTSIVIGPAAVVSGFQFPLLIACVGRGRDHVGSQLGRTFAWNTAGAIVGSIAGGFVLLPLLTAPGLWKTSVVMLILLGVSLWLGAFTSRDSQVKDPQNDNVKAISWISFPTLATFALCLIAIYFVSAAGPTAVWRHSGIGAGRAVMEGRGANEQRDFANQMKRRIIWEAEGIESSVAISATDGLSFIVNGKVDGNAISDAGTQIGLGLLGTLIHPEPQTGLVIGLGTGESAGWMAHVSSLRSVDVVELEPTVTEMARLCSSVNHDVMNHPKIQVHFEDAREFLLTADRRYDLIVSEPSNPYRAGIANLYTHEFYASASERLTSDGLFLQWLQAYEVDLRTVEIVMATLRSVFPRVQVWQSKSRDLVFVAGAETAWKGFSKETLTNSLQQPEISDGMGKAWRTNDRLGVLAHFVCTETTIDDLLRERPRELNHDDRNVLEYAFAKSVGKDVRFSVDDLTVLANKLDDRSPFPVTDDELAVIRQRRLAMNLHLGGEVSADSGITASSKNDNADISQDIQRALAMNAYLDGRYQIAVDTFEQISINDDCWTESVVVAHARAEVGKPVAAVLLAKIRERNETEALCVEAIGWQRQGMTKEALESCLLALDRSKTDPWILRSLADGLFRVAISLAEQDKPNAEAVFKSLDSHFAIKSFEDKRLLSRYVVSESLSREQTIEALAEIEPYVPWKEWFLEKRVSIYRRASHPLLSRSQQDLLEFRYNKNR
ncbi:Spermidine synthase [Rubripirellula amarantea]|uniref:Spermidine synthase n=1 Tax=Rubripirellula amarantea TaxID=2527999 RepID=A0A5C5WRD7_9BACT|nr:fused MFS/spermidine synthase [Rubripirellula amarantea]TWT52681.1 Spermidine synthase [Rubripirellula amarantea]